ncbi:glycosyltransferase family 4 protein [Rhodococcus sp. IEGM 1343]|uniref:glycosyltransferase family 4 protein n=1 Tax=Rhodococcus sp. IEGM 1343 TaxID=3082224 RepID=UPI0029543E21|nr:glycosyltransferase family 4 protein [Rhodococcus sp. IEGM 1343]MDV8055980.1 glycosyltransferase family 4 protein [Rhodococcus sp. IEGM 1343]
MKIAVVNSFYSNSQPSGENIAVADQVAALREFGHEVRVFGRESPAEEAGIRYKAKSAVTVAGFAGPNPTQELAAFDPQIVHVHNLFPNWSSNWLQEWSTKLVTTLHNYRAVCSAATLFRSGASCTECLDSGSLAAVRHKCYRSSALATVPLAYATRDRGSHFMPATQAQSLITLNRTAQELFQSIYPAVKVERVPNFVNPSKVLNAESRLGWVYAGRLTAEKGIQELLQNWPLGARLEIYGGGDLEDLVARLAAERTDITHHGLRPRDEVVSALGRANGLILPSLWSEGIPTIAIEALSMGTPLVVSDRVAAAAELTAGDSGVVFSPTDGLSYQPALDSVLATAGAMGLRAVNLFETQYGRDVWLERINRIYAEIHLNDRR